MRVSAGLKFEVVVRHCYGLELRWRGVQRAGRVAWRSVDIAGAIRAKRRGGSRAAGLSARREGGGCVSGLSQQSVCLLQVLERSRTWPFWNGSEHENHVLQQFADVIWLDVGCAACVICCVAAGVIACACCGMAVVGGVAVAVASWLV
jgi:hypothetical protein